MEFFWKYPETQKTQEKLKLQVGRHPDVPKKKIKIKIQNHACSLLISRITSLN